MSTPLDETLARRLAPPRGEDELELTPGELDAALDAVSGALEVRAALQTSRTRTRVATVLAAAAAVVLIVALWRSAGTSSAPLAAVETSGEVADVTSPLSHAVSTGAALEAGQRLKTAEGALTLRFPEGTRVSVGARSELGIHGLGRHRSFELTQGHFEAQVAKLKADETFVVTTRRARVEVRGTQFSVDVQRPSSTCRDGEVRVRVTEGVVAVAIDDVVTEVRAGQDKVLDCGRAVDAGTPDVTPTPPPRKPGNAGSQLSRMNALYGKAMDLKQAERLEEAARTFRELRRTFPGSPLDEAAAVEELRLLERLASPRGAAAAREYLREYPDGYGRDVAERLAPP